jgi:hypothetical protein
MSESLALGAADAESRWIGIRRHQAVLVVAGVGLVGDWVTRSGSHLLEVAVGLGLAVGAAPAYDGLTVFELLMDGVRYLARSRWTLVMASARDAGVRVRARGEVSVRGFELMHRGRLDLSGQDRVLNEALIAFADGLSNASGSRHFSIHVLVGRNETRTTLALPLDIAPPEGWHPNADIIGEVVGGRGQSSNLHLERWHHLRSSTEVLRVLRIHDFSGVAAGGPLLERLQNSSSWSELSLHVDVVSGQRAQRIAARAVHGTGSDVAMSSSAGFRRTARTARSLERLRQREALVAGGRSLVHLGVFIVVRAPSLFELSEAVRAVRGVAHTAGLRCQRGGGRQAVWYCQQLPGGPGW